MKKLLIVTDSFLPRWEGISRFLLEIIPKLSQDYEITLVAPKLDDREYIVNGAKLVRFSVVNIQFADLYPAKFHYREISELVKEHNIIFVQSIGPLGLSAIRAAKKNNRPIVIYAHMIEHEVVTKSIGKLKLLVKQLTKLLMNYAYNKANLILVPYPEIGELHRKQGIKVPYAIVPLGVDTDKFCAPENKKQAKEKLGINPRHLVIGFVGRLGREKNLLTLYRAFRRLEKKYDFIKLLIVGKGIREEEKVFSHDRNIIMAGWTDDVVPYLQAMDIFVMPSLIETSSLATMEAMASGLPVVATPAGLINEYIAEKENGFLFPFKNSLVLSMKLEKLINEPRLRQNIGENARKTIKEKFNWNKTVALIKDAIRYF